MFREHLEHSNITFNENGTVTAIPKHPLTYIPELSGGAEDDILILPNIALLVGTIIYIFIRIYDKFHNNKH